MVELSAQTFDALLAASWKPRPLFTAEAPDPYPYEAFPPIVRDAINETVSYVQAPPAMVAGCALAAMSASVQTRFSVRRDAVLCGPSGLYILTIAESGERKSTVDKIFTAPIREWEARQEQTAKLAMEEFQSDLRIWEQQQEESPDGSERPKPPRVPRMLRGEDTPEALAAAAVLYPVIAVISAEAGVIFGGVGMSADTVTRTLAQYNAMWDGGPIDQGRITRDRVRIDEIRVTVSLQVQPAALERFTEKTAGIARGVGFLARCLISQPPSTQGTRLYQAPPSTMPKISAFQARVSDLLQHPAEFDEFDRLVTRDVPLSAEAHEVWASFHDEVEMQLVPDQEYADIRDVASKAAENAARIACCIQIFAGGPTEAIEATSMRKACVIMRWYLDEALRFGRKHSKTPELLDAGQLEEFLITHHRKLAVQSAQDTLSVNMVRQLGPNRLRTSRPRLDGALQLLQDYGRIRVQKGHGSKTEYIQIAPQVLSE